MTTAMTDLETAWADEATSLAEIFFSYYQVQVERALKRFGPSLRGIGNDHGYARAWRSKPAGIVKSERDPENLGKFVFSFDEEGARAAAKMAAEATVAEYRAKVEQKIGELDEASVRAHGGGDFVIYGKKDGKTVSVRQQRISKISKNGVFFYQFPARIKVDGKPVAAADYDAMISA